MQTGSAQTQGTQEGDAPVGEEETEEKPRQEEDLTEKKLANMAACEADETWTTLRQLRPHAEEFLLGTVRSHPGGGGR